MYSLHIEFVNGDVLEKTAAYSLKISTWLFDSWQRRNDTVRVELLDSHGRFVNIVEKREPRESRP